MSSAQVVEWSHTRHDKQASRVSPGARLLLPLLLVGLLLAVMPPAGAQEDPPPPEPEGEAPAGASGADQSLQGRLVAGQDPVAGAVIRAFRGQEQVGEAVTDADGRWLIALPEPGTYRVVLDVGTLPEGVEPADPGAAEREITVPPGRTRSAVFPLGGELGVAARLIPRIAQAGVNGLKFGLIVAMTAIGLSLVFGTTRLVNFAHGELVTFGAVVAFFLNTSGPRLQLIPAAALAVAAGAVLGGALETGLWRPLRDRKTGIIQLLVVSIGLALLIRHVVLLVLGGRPRPYVDYTVQSPLALGPILITPRDLTVILLSAVVLVGVGLLLLRSRLGKAMRAVADNRDLAESSGIDVRRVILVVWLMAGGLAALGGVFLGVVESVDWLMGFRALLLMFAAVILGGLGTAFGAMAGGLVVGLVTEVSAVFQPVELKFMWALVALILVLILRPHGIFGRRERIG